MTTRQTITQTIRKQCTQYTKQKRTIHTKEFNNGKSSVTVNLGNLENFPF